MQAATTETAQARSAAMTPQAIHEQINRLKVQVSELERQRQALAFDAAGGDTSAIDARAHLRTQIDELRHELATLDEALPVAVRRERETLERELTHRIARAREEFEAAEHGIERDVSAMKSVLGVPAFDDLERFYQTARVFLRRRAMLASLTGDADLSRPLDLMDRVRFYWHQQAEERERLLRRLVHGSRQGLPVDDFDRELNTLLALKHRLNANGDQA
jgi:DNA repair exonuclease SbcCD ATPase subunit